MILDVTDQTFQTEVIQRSSTMAVVVDLWAPWCGPCKTLGPIIEAAVNDANAGAAEPKVALVKINVDENPQASQAFRVQSIPAVFALKDGQMVDSFTGAQPAAEVNAFVSRLLPTAADLEVESLLGIGDEPSLQQILDVEPGHAAAVPALAELYVEEGRHQEAIELLARIPETDDVRRIAALARTGLSTAAATHADVEIRLAELLDVVKGNDEARQEFVDLLAVLGAEHPNTATWRRQLSTRLY